jgi:hypothetical protein
MASVTTTVGLSVSAGLWAAARAGLVIMLQGGPLDGEVQSVEMVPSTPGDELFFNVPNYQTFDPAQPEVEVLIGQGLQAVYALVGPGPGPGPTDTWLASFIFEFTGEAFVPIPPPLAPPGPQPPVALTQVWMTATTTLVPDTHPIIIGPMVKLVAESDLDVDAEVTRVQDGVVALSGETVMSVTPDWTPKVYMTVTSSMFVQPS